MVKPTVLYQLSKEDLTEALKSLFNEWRDSLPTCENSNNRDKLFTPEEVQSSLSISPSTLWRLGKTNKLKPVLVSGLRRYRQSDIDNYLNRD